MTSYRAQTDQGRITGTVEELMTLVEQHTELKRGHTGQWITRPTWGPDNQHGGGFQYVTFNSKGRELGLSSGRFHRGVIVQPAKGD